MPPPTLGQGRTFETPPMSLMEKDRELYDYLFLLHARIFGIGQGTKGDLDLDNINPDIIPEVPEGHNAATHNKLIQALAIADLLNTDQTTATSLSVTTADAGGAYTAAERDLINELKADLNALFAEYNIAIDKTNIVETKLNDLLASLRAGNLLAK